MKVPPAYSENSSSDTVLLSVVIPTLNEELHIVAALESCLREGAVEVLVVDGESTDRTISLAEDLGVRTLVTPAQRARQMNLGASVTRGRNLLFLHGDTQLPRDYRREVLRILGEPGVSGGAFSLRIQGNRAGFRFIEKGIDLRSRWFGLPYGDQGIFVRRATFEQLGGFPEIPIMEDVELIRKLGRLGKISVSRQAVTTSARRWDRLGPGRTTLLNQIVIMAYFLRVSPRTVARIYGTRLQRAPESG